MQILLERRSVSVTKLAMELHILPIQFRILYKISLIIFKCIHGNAPDYLKDLCCLSPKLVCVPQIVLIILYLCLFLNIAKFQMSSDILLLQYEIIYHLLSDLLLLCQTLSLPLKLIILILLIRMCD